MAIVRPRSATPRTTARAVAIDVDGMLPGRGAYLCRSRPPGEGRPWPNAACLAQAIRRRAIARALRCAVTVPDELVESTGR